ncbi:multidrug effflux MFS transporter [Thalassobaculum sp.]|uniref:multidrug effflux MFS transporter n=1 Tax=Thalassobaculum sp. TaxID=2022740 RepID=UPI0032ECEA60
MLPASFQATRPGSIALLTFMVALNQMSMGLYLPSMPTMAGALGTTVGQVQLTLTVFIAGFAVSQLVWGPVTDRFGRRPALLVGLACFTVASIACAFAATVEQLIAYRFFQALGACAGQVVSRSIVRDTTEGAESAKVMSYIALAMSLSPAVTPSIGGQLHAFFGWRSNFVLLAVIGLTLAAITVARLPETTRRKVPDALHLVPMLRNYGSLLRDRRYVGYILMIGGMFGCLMAYQTGSPFVLMTELGWSPQAYGLLILFNVFGFLAGSLTAARIAPRYGIPRMVRLSSIVVLVSGLLLLAFPLAGHLSTAAVIAPMMLFLFGMGIGIPSAMAGTLQGFPYIAGSASALMGFSQMGVGVLTSLAVSRIDGDHHLVMGAVFAASGLMCFLSQALILRRVPAAR